MRRLLASKRSAFALIVLGCSTVLLFVGKLTGAEWLDLTKLLVTTVVIGHTVSHAVESNAKRPSPP